jgi:hypothetical protein
VQRPDYLIVGMAYSIVARWGSKVAEKEYQREKAEKKTSVK